MTLRLYDACALGLGLYARARYRVRSLGAEFRASPGTLVVSSHRSDDDVPVIVGALYREAHGLWRRTPRLHFAVRDDLFLPGFFAGYPPGVPRRVRRAVFNLNVGPILRSQLPCHPIRSATKMRLLEYLREHPDERLDALLPPRLAGPLHDRRGRVTYAREVLNGDYADLLWQALGPDDVDGPHADESWARRSAGARIDFRDLVGVVRGGAPLCIFPEGRPSPDGSIGPVLGGVGAIVRRASPTAVVAIAPAYDPLVDGRVHAFVGVGEPVEPPRDGEAVLDLLRRMTPLTVGESVAAAIADCADPYARLEADVESARASGRPYEPELDDGRARRRRVETALRHARGRDLGRLVLTYRSARA
jgi:1-acyl-sn-glycerol-3-phosphate acyltransferase